MERKTITERRRAYITPTLAVAQIAPAQLFAQSDMDPLPGNPGSNVRRQSIETDDYFENEVEY